MRKSNITGKTFNNLTAIEPTCERKFGQVVWIFKCKCGNIHKSLPSPVKRGAIKSCGCMRTTIHTEHLIGHKFNRLTAINPTDKRKGGAIIWQFLCECGKIIETDMDTVKRNETKSCGCYAKEILPKILDKYREQNKIERRKKCMLKNRDINKRGLLENNDWQKSIYKKYNYTCDKCNKTNCKVCAHHLNAWNSFPKERFNIENGVCLCIDCHIKFHKIYGYGNNTIKQYIEFKELK